MWLKENCPCSVSDYYANCAPLMPTHISQFRKLSDPKFSTAKEALARLVKGSRNDDPLVKLSGDTIELVPEKKSNSTYDYSWIPKESEVGATLNLSEFGFDSKRRNSSKMVLKRKGYVWVGNGVYEYRGRSGHE